VYARTVGREELTFGVSGMLWRDNLVMYDRQTDSWWAQAEGRAIQGPKRGARLEQVPSDMMSWEQWRTLHPRTRVLFTGASGAVRDTYASYHRSRALGVTRRTKSGGSLDPKRLVVGFRLDRDAFAVPLDAVTKADVLQVRAAVRSVVLVALADGSGVRAFLAGKDTFERTGKRDGRILLRDQATSSTWDGFEGRAISGPRENDRLVAVTAHVSYWFSWFSFFPESTVLDGAGKGR
jgi:hypothetical protein